MIHLEGRKGVKFTQHDDSRFVKYLKKFCLYIYDEDSCPFLGKEGFLCIELTFKEKF